MGNIVFYCPKCDQKIKAPDIMANEVGECPNCQAPVMIPALASSREEPKPPSREYPTGQIPSPADAGSAPSRAENSAPVSVMPDYAADADRLSLGMDYDGTSKPVALAMIPALLSLMPGLGQAYNLNVKKAFLFAILFIGSVTLAIFQPAVGGPAVFLTIFLAMCDAYGTAQGGGFFSGTGRGIVLALKSYGFLVGLLLWMALSALFFDAIATRNLAGASIVATVDFSGTGVATRTVNPWLTASMVLGSALLLFFLQSFGRKHVWARKRPNPFMVSLRMALSAFALTGLLAATSRLMAEETAGKTLAVVFNLPLAILHRLLALPQTVGGMLDKTWPSWAPGFLVPATTALQAFGRSVGLSYANYGNVYRFVLLVGLIGLVPLFLRSMLRLARDLPGYGDWMAMWMTVTRERSRHLRSEWQTFRDELAVARERRQARAESFGKEVAVMNATADRRLARLEAIASRLAEHMGVSLPPPDETPLPSPAEAPLSPPGMSREKIKAGASKALVLSRTAIVVAGAYLVRASKALARSVRALKKIAGQAANRFREKRRESALIRAELKATKAESNPKSVSANQPEVDASTASAEPNIGAATSAPKSEASLAVKPAPTVKPVSEPAAKPSEPLSKPETPNSAESTQDVKPLAEPMKPTPRVQPPAAQPKPEAAAVPPAPGPAKKPVKLMPSANTLGKDGVIKLESVSKSGDGGVIKLG